MVNTVAVCQLMIQIGNTALRRFVVDEALKIEDDLVSGAIHPSSSKSCD